MTPNWTEQREALREWLLSHPRILIGCDFDGTLAPLMPHADEARLPRVTGEAMQRLIALPGVALAVISGRAIADLRQRVALDGAWYAGNHGLEMAAADGSTVVAPGAEDARAALRHALGRLAPLPREMPGVWIEDKGLTASVHYRQASEDCRAQLEACVREAVKGLEALKVRPAKCIWEILPAGEWDKGTALRWFMNRWGVPSNATAFMGDDVTDLNAFRELPDGWTILVGNDVDVKARMRLRHPGDTAMLLEWMAKVRA